MRKRVVAWLVLVAVAFIMGAGLHAVGALAVAPLLILGLAYIGAAVNENVKEKKA